MFVQIGTDLTKYIFILSISSLFCSCMNSHNNTFGSSDSNTGDMERAFKLIGIFDRFRQIYLGSRKMALFDSKNASTENFQVLSILERSLRSLEGTIEIVNNTSTEKRKKDPRHCASQFQGTAWP